MIQNNNIKYKIILASKSPRRIEIFNRLGIKFQPITSNYDEASLKIDNPIEFAKIASLNKAKVIADNYKDSLVISADTIVVLNNEIIGKPTSKENAIEILEKLSNNTHEVITGFSMIKLDDNIEIVDYEVTEVTFRKLTKNEIIEYITEYKPFDKAGAYGIQDIKAMLVKKINGCYFNVIGFPVAKFYETFMKLGI